MDDGSKRKRAAVQDITLPSKRQALTQALTPEAIRQQIKEIYAAYDALNRLDPQGQGGETEYAVLLTAANGCGATQRLAARLLPRFAPRFPSQAQATAATLSALACLRLDDGLQQQDASATRSESLSGLQRLMEGNPALAEATLRSTLSELSAQGVGGGWSVTDDDDRAAEQVQALWEVCTSAFRASPGPALAALLEMVATIDHPMASIAAEALEHHLLAPDAGPGVGNGAIDAANGQAQNGGNGPPVARSLAAAAFIAAGSLDDIQAAVQAVQKFCRGVASGAGARLRSSLQDLGADLAPYARKSASKKSPSPAPGSTQPGTAAQGGGKRRRPSKWADSATAAAAPSKAPTRPRKAPSRQATPSQLEEGELNEPGQLRASSSPTGGIGAAPVGASQPRLGSEASFPRGGAYPPPGGPVTLAAACLHFWGLPRVISDQELGDACARFGRVVAVAFPPGPADGTGYVTFKSLRDASRCYEAMAAQTYFRGGNALRVSFCATEARPPGARGAPGGDRPATHVWVAGPASPAEENDLLADISAGGGGTPEHMLRVEGRWPGVVLAFSSPQAAEKACQALTHKPPRSRAPDMGRGRGRTPPMDAAGPPGRGRRPDHEVADLAHRTLWVGQVPPGQHAERELLSTFGRFGELVGHRFMHRSGCAFVDYARLEDAVEARRALDGVCIAGSYLVVEFKDEKQKLQKGRGPGGPPPAYPPPRRSRSSSRSPPPQGSPPFSKPPLGMSRAGSSLPTAGRGPARWDAPSPPSRITSMMSSELPPPLPQQRSNPPKPTPGAAPSAPAQMPNSGRSRQANMFWTGVLAKSRQPQCEVACIDGPALAPVSWAGAEPLEWPAALDVMNRTDVRWVCGHLFSSLPQESKAVRRIVAAGAAPEQSAKLAAFATYLLQKERAGVVALDPARGAPPRTMYLIPPTEETCAKLDVVYPPADEPCMLALVVPAGAGT